MSAHLYEKQKLAALLIEVEFRNQHESKLTKAGIVELYLHMLP
jgi:hypothetical protein